MITCIKCRQRHSEANHECLEVMTLDQLHSLPPDVTTFLIREELHRKLTEVFVRGPEHPMCHSRLDPFDVE